jgi:ABC-type bacteriocin/lantibiotic exporter with double-glycine peptidase domain
MLFQETNYSCGAAAIANMLRCYGRKFSERTLRKMAGTNPEGGTSGAQIGEALKKLGYRVKHHFPQGSYRAKRRLKKLLRKGPVIVSFQNDTHWILALSVFNDAVVFFNSCGCKKHRRENGVDVFSIKDFMATWRGRGLEGANGITGEFYAISIEE